MKISEYIAALEALKAEHGDLEVETSNGFTRITARPPVIAFRTILSRMERTQKFWRDYCDPIEKRGEKVARV